MRLVEAVSNEIELALHGVHAERLLQCHGRRLNIQREVNPHHVVELNVSMAPDVRELNSEVQSSIAAIVDTVERERGLVYGGGAVIEDVSAIDPTRYRTTAMSDRLARGLLDIMGQQLVIGVTDEVRGLELYDALKNVSPALMTLFAASPFQYAGDETIVDTTLSSLRPARYAYACANLPDDMWQGIPDIASLAAHRELLRNVSQEATALIESGRMDTHPALSEHYPFDALEPHQVYHSIRLREDHETVSAGGNSLFSIEMRVPDTPMTAEGMCAMNNLLYGIILDVEERGNTFLYRALGFNLNGHSHTAILDAGAQGFNFSLSGRDVREQISAITNVAESALQRNGYHSEAVVLEAYVRGRLVFGNDADRMRAAAPIDAGEARTYLATQLRGAR